MKMKNNQSVEIDVDPVSGGAAVSMSMDLENREPENRGRSLRYPLKIL